jgi:PKD repeat protein
MKKTILLLLLLMFSLLLAQWEPLDPGVNDNLYGTYFFDDNTGFAVGWGASTGAVALKTTNGGADWTSTVLSFGAYVFSVNFTDEDHGYAAGCLNGGAAGAVFKTINGGDSWTHSTFSSTYGMYDVEFANSQTGFTCGWLGEIRKTTNGGSSWSSINSGTTNVLRWMSIVDENNGFIVGGSNWNNPNILYKMTNGSSWSYSYNFGSTVIGGVHFFDEQTGVVCGGSGGEIVLKTYDGGASWEEKFNHASGLLQSLHFDGSGIGYACGNNGRVIMTYDFGETWEEFESTSPAVTLLGIFGVEGSVFTVGVNGNAFKGAVSSILDADFRGDQLSGASPLTVHFTDQSTGEPTAWWWDFDNDGMTDAQTQDAYWTFIEPGEYTISQLISNGADSDMEIKENYISVMNTSQLVDEIFVDEISLQNYPNPFNPETRIDYILSEEGVVSISVYDIRGRLVKTLVNGYRSEGEYSVFWSGDDQKGNSVGSGIYFYSLKTNKEISSRQMILIK